MLVDFELHDEMTQAIQREKQIKKWNRSWKLRMIELKNSDWRDLWPDIV
jgi:putative endonuclease